MEDEIFVSAENLQKVAQMTIFICKLSSFQKDELMLSGLLYRLSDVEFLTRVYNEQGWHCMHHQLFIPLAQSIRCALLYPVGYKFFEEMYPEGKKLYKFLASDKWLKDASKILKTREDFAVYDEIFTSGISNIKK